MKITRTGKPHRLETASLAGSFLQWKHFLQVKGEGELKHSMVEEVSTPGNLTVGDHRGREGIPVCVTGRILIQFVETDQKHSRTMSYVLSQRSDVSTSTSHSTNTNQLSTSHRLIVSCPALPWHLHRLMHFSIPLSPTVLTAVDTPERLLSDGTVFVTVLNEWLMFSS